MNRIFVALILLSTVNGCARLEGGNWPGLHEGFTPRAAPVAAPDTIGVTGSDEAAETSAQAVPVELATQVGEARVKLETLLAQAEAHSGENAGVGTAKELSWYESQLELSRMGRFIDMLAPYPDALADLEVFLHGMRERLGKIEPTK